MTDTMLEAIAATIKKRQQADTMGPMQWVDQHGRTWAGQTQTTSQGLHPCTPITPLGWAPPSRHLVPLQEDMRFGATIGRVHIDYDAWISRVALANQNFENHVQEMAARLFPNNPAEAIRDRNPVLMKAVGQAPMHVDFVRAMKAGNPWALGITKPDGTRYAPPSRLEAVLHTLTIIETHAGTVPTSLMDVDADEFLSPDQEETETVAVVADAEFGEVVQPVRRGPGRPRKHPVA